MKSMLIKFLLFSNLFHAHGRILTSATGVNSQDASPALADDSEFVNFSPSPPPPLSSDSFEIELEDQEPVILPEDLDPVTEDEFSDVIVEDLVIYDEVRPVENPHDMCYSKCKEHHPTKGNSRLTKIDVERLGRGEDIIRFTGEKADVRNKKEIVMPNNDVILVHDQEVVRVRDDRLVLDVEGGRPTRLDDTKITKLHNGDRVTLDDGTAIRLKNDEIVRDEDDMRIFVHNDDREKLRTGVPNEVDEDTMKRIEDSEVVHLDEGLEVKISPTGEIVRACE